MLCSFFSVKYYTGQTPYSLYENLKNNISVYYQYQNFFKEQNRGILSITKIPYILMLFFVKFIFFSTMLYFFNIKKERKKNIQKCLIGISIGSYLYLGMARGTNFEMFEFLLIIIYILFSNSSKKKLILNIVKIVILIVLMIIVYNLRIQARGFNFSYYISKDVFYTKDSFISNFGRIIEFMILIIYGYFGFGFFYTGKFISEILLKSPINYIGLFIPKWNMVVNGENVKQSMSKIVDVGVKWNPDIVLCLDKYGYILLACFFYYLGVISKKSYQTNKKNLLDELTKFFILIFFISLPIGNFIGASSSNKLIVIILICYQIKKIKRRKNV